MQKTLEIETATQEQMNQVAEAMRKAIDVYFEAGYSPGSIVGGLMIAVHQLMQAQKMSKMQISNELNRFVDGVREMAFVENKKLN